MYYVCVCVYARGPSIKTKREKYRKEGYRNRVTLNCLYA